MTALITQQISSTRVNTTLALTAVLFIFLYQYGYYEFLYNFTAVKLKHISQCLAGMHFIQAFIASFTVIIFSELGDKTFFISAIMAMKNSRFTVFMASMTANSLNNAISVSMGMIATFIPKFITDYLSIVLFTFFGIKMIVESRRMSDSSNEELEEAEEELKKLGDEHKDKHLENGFRHKLLAYVSIVFIETFSLIFFAEWGDRSQISTIVLTAREDPLGVTFGALCGYCVCSAIAVLGGRFMAQMISIRTVTLIGGILFIIFAVFALLM